MAAPTQDPHTDAPRVTPAFVGTAVWIVAAVAAVAAAFSGAEPTGWAASDVVWTAGFAFFVVVAAARARRWTWLVLAGITATAAQGNVALAVSLVAVLVAFVSAAFDHQTREYQPAIGAVVAALAVQVLLRLHDIEPSGATALITAAATAPALVSGLRRCTPRVRKAWGWGLAAFVVLAVLAAAGLAVSAFSARSDLSAGIDQARNGFDAARDGEGAVAARRLTRSASSFGTAHDTLTAPWALPARLVPALGQQAAAVQIMSDEGASLASAAAQAATDADVDELRFQDGAIDLDLVASFEQPLRDAEAALQGAADAVDAVQSPWLVRPLASRVAKFDDEVDQALPDAQIAIQGVELAPDLLGGNGERHYLLAFLTPSENRSLGGFLGSFGELTASDGDLELTRSGSVEDLELPARANNATLSGPEEYLARYGRFQIASYMGDAGVSPDMPSVGQVLAELYPQAGGQSVDGVIAVDPVALQAMLTFTGPITVTGYPEPLTADNAADILLRQQYLTFDQRSDRKDFLEEATRNTFDLLTSGDLPGPRQVTQVLGPMVDQGRLMAYGSDADEQAFFEQVGLDGAFPRTRGGDLIGLVTNNAANNKIDIFMERSIDYRANYDPTTGSVASTATITIANNAPASGLPDVILSSGDRIRGGDTPLGTSGVNFSVYSPLRLDDAVARSALGEGELTMNAEREFGMFVYSAMINIPAGQSVTIEMQLSGTINPSDTYRLTVANQPTVNPDTVTLSVTPQAEYTAESGGGWEIRDDGTATRTADTTDGDQRYRLQLISP